MCAREEITAGNTIIYLIFKLLTVSILRGLFISQSALGGCSPVYQRPMARGHMSNKTISPLIDWQGYESQSRDGQSCQRWNTREGGGERNMLHGVEEEKDESWQIMEEKAEVEWGMTKLLWGIKQLGQKTEWERQRSFLWPLVPPSYLNKPPRTYTCMGTSVCLIALTWLFTLFIFIALRAYKMIRCTQQHSQLKWVVFLDLPKVGVV